MSHLKLIVSNPEPRKTTVDNLRIVSIDVVVCALASVLRDREMSDYSNRDIRLMESYATDVIDILRRHDDDN